MTERVSHRHEGDLGGALRPFDETRRAPLTVVVSPEYAEVPAAQHTAWMLLNLLCRMDGIVDQVGLICPPVRLQTRTIPLAPSAGTLEAALLAGCAEVGVVPVVPNVQHERRLSVGPAATDDSLRVWGQGWTGGVSWHSLEPGAPSPLPFGPYVAATLAATEVFKAARAGGSPAPMQSSNYFSAWEMRGSNAPILSGPRSVEGAKLSAAIAGIGAVGSTAVHALWATPALQGDCALIDSDNFGIDLTNLNRYPLFGRSSLGRPKATEAARVARETILRWDPFDLPFAQFAQDHALPSRILSAVDLNTSRREIQLRYPPRIISASTMDLRAEVTRCGPPGIGACLCCFNPIDMGPTDAQLQQQVRAMTLDQRTAKAAELGMPLEELNEFAETGRCGTSSARLMTHLRSGPTLPLFAVSFVAVLSGTLAAAELIKDTIGASAALDDRSNNVKVQLWDPAANVARPYGRDATCECCHPSVALDMWSRRFAEVGPQRPGGP